MTTSPAPLNAFKERLAGGGCPTGLWLSLGEASVAEVCADAGFDWLLVDGEHGPNDVRSTLDQLRAIGDRTGTVVRPPSGRADGLRPLIDIGVRTFLIPMVESAAQARELVRATRYPPHGTRGVASAVTRASRWNRTPGYLGAADAAMCLIPQIETPGAVAAAADIAAVDGVDALFVGLYDLSAALGHLGAPDHPDVWTAFTGVVAACRGAGKPCGTFAPTPELAAAARREGCSFVAVGSDVGLLVQGAAELLARSRAAGRP
ncbi:HpcH/HpaI aldolase/citrate lyase family protein [Streptomyces sp. MNP-20]|uniref:HpcH/HpaI aldolase family protein n=1 Tax=Streptomyces sp. MNP-20 TaxID=2721165 RepID=UPI0015566886|nr:HpcH/HpaI aldolase/citrate lyase family protein [Streptomyces sp. MNP-20]